MEFDAFLLILLVALFAPVLLAIHEFAARFAAARRVRAAKASQSAVPASLVTYHRLPYG